jgi:hypothetical protein
MADQLYLSLWFPNFRLQALPDAMVCVLRQFITVSREGGAHPELARVAAASAYPIDWAESPIYQRIYENQSRARELEAERSEASDADTSLPENAVAEATEQLHDDTAYGFETRWRLWVPEPFASLASAPTSTSAPTNRTATSASTSASTPPGPSKASLKRS